MRLRKRIRRHEVMGSLSLDFSLSDLNKQLILYRKEALDELSDGLKVPLFCFGVIRSVKTKSGRQSS